MLNYGRIEPDPPYVFDSHDDYVPETVALEPALAEEPEWMVQQRVTSFEWLAANN